MTVRLDGGDTLHPLIEGALMLLPTADDVVGADWTEDGLEAWMYLFECCLRLLYHLPKPPSATLAHVLSDMGRAVAATHPDPPAVDEEADVQPDPDPYDVAVGPVSPPPTRPARAAPARPRPDQPRHRRQWSDADKAEAVARLRRGETIRDVADDLDLSDSVLRRWARTPSVQQHAAELAPPPATDPPRADPGADLDDDDAWEAEHERLGAHPAPATATDDGWESSAHATPPNPTMGQAAAPAPFQRARFDPEQVRARAAEGL